MLHFVAIRDPRRTRTNTTLYALCERIDELVRNVLLSIESSDRLLLLVRMAYGEMLVLRPVLQHMLR